MRSLLVTFLLAGFQLSAQALPLAGAELIQSESDGNFPALNYKKYRLTNGLTVLLHQDKSDPLVHVDMTYHVGSAREELGKSGFAHFFEHMMFQGSKHVSSQQHMRMITEAGGSVNGSTNRDRTNYYQTVPANQLEKILWLEADRMGFLLDAVSQQKFEIQRDTVKNERAQNYENRPYGLVWETVAASLFPATHPYHWPTIGYPEELDKVNVDDLKAFFLRWYGPNNATLSIGGDIDEEKALQWVIKYFGSIAQGPKVERQKPRPVTLPQTRFVTLQDKIAQPLLVLSWPTQYLGASSQLALDMAASVLGQGRTSRLYQALVQTGKVLSVNAEQNCDELACVWQITALARQDQPLSALYRDIQQVLKDFAASGVTAQELLQLQGTAEASAVFAMQSVKGKVTQLAYNDLFFYEPNQTVNWLSKLRALNAKALSLAFTQFIAEKPHVVLSVVPHGRAELAAKSANFSVTRHTYAPKPASPFIARESASKFDRSLVPKEGASVSIKIPTLYRTLLPNGMELAGTKDSETPTTTLYLLLPAGEQMAPEQKIGLASLTAQLLQEGTLTHTSEQLAIKLEQLGSSVNVSASDDRVVVAINTLSKNLEPTLGIAQEILFTPRFDAADFARIKKQHLERLALAQQRPSWWVRRAANELLYQDPWRRLAAGSNAAVSSITLDDVRQFYRDNYTPDKARLIAISDLSQETLLEKFTSLRQWQGKKAQLPHPVQMKTPAKSTLWLVDKPDAKQSSILFLRAGLPFDATGEQFKTDLVNFNLAGNFNSRLNQVVREEKGFSYGVRSSVNGFEKHGTITFSTDVRADVTADAIIAMKNELEQYAKEGLTAKELAFLRSAMGQQEALNYEDPDDKAYFIAYMLKFGLQPDFVAAQKQIIEQVSLAELNALAAKWFSPSSYQIVVVGDKKSIESQLLKQGLSFSTLALTQE
ncbi:MAG: M16 family metallopeptidase [Enterovibrio sp.]